jgi:Glycosyl transferase family 2
MPESTIDICRTRSGKEKIPAGDDSAIALDRDEKRMEPVQGAARAERILSRTKPRAARPRDLHRRATSEARRSGGRDALICHSMQAEREQRRSGPAPRWKRYGYDVMAAEISSLTRYYDRAIRWPGVTGDTGYLFEQIDCGVKQQLTSALDLPDLRQERSSRTAIVMNGALNYDLDIHSLLTFIRGRLARTSRLVVVVYNPYLAWLYKLANCLGLRASGVPLNFLSYADIRGIAKLSGFEMVRARRTVYFPWRLLGLGSLINRFASAIPFVSLFSLASIIVLRPVIREEDRRPSLSIIVPARNERGNIEAAVARIPDLKAEVELLFVEGHSTDGTWEEIQRVVQGYDGPMRIRAVQQSGKGKNDAVRLGFSLAAGEVLTILDADLTMPPERLTQFFEAYCDGRADFINGTRLVYPMEGNAMRFLNRLGNVFFAKSVGKALDTTLGDTLCGTKMVARHDYARMTAWRLEFGDFDPFGDFELLFPAAVLGLGIVDVPIRYLARTYGSTNIDRFRHGLMLLKMTLVGIFRVKLRQVP